jgi:hypothetical protein
MSDNRERERMVFETSEEIKRAIRIRAAMEGLKPADVVNAALTAYLHKELALAKERMADVEVQKPARDRK